MRLYPVNSPPVVTNSESTGQEKGRPNEPLASIPETMATDALNTVRLSEDLSRDDEKEMDGAEIVGTQSSATVPSSSANLELKKSKMTQGR